MTAKSYLKVSPSTWKAIKYIYVKVTPSTWKKVKNIYVKVTPSKWTKTFGTVDSPTQLTRPTLSGTGRVGTSITKSPGTYSNYDSIVNKIFYTTDETLPGDGYSEEVIYGNTKSTSSYTIDQTDATPPPNIFYSRDEVTGTDGVTKYYYYSDPITATMQGIEDNFNNRTTASGLGVASGGFIYSSYARSTSSWSVNGSRAVNNSNGSGYPLQTVDINSANQNVSVDTFGGGLGLAVWVSSANSWWAVIPEYSYSQQAATDYQCESTYTYLPEGEDCPPVASLGSNPQSTGYTFSDVGLRCSQCYEQSTTETTYPCTGVGTSRYGCPDTGPLGGDRCGECYQGDGYLDCTDYISGQSSCPPLGENAGQRCSNCNSTTIETYPCTVYQTGTCPGSIETGNQAGNQCTSCQTETDSYDVCDNYVTGQASCNQCTGACTPTTNTTYPCTGYVSGASSCPGTGSLGGDACSTCTSSTTTSLVCNTYVTGRTFTGGTGTNLGDRCSSATSSTNTTYPCTGSVTGSSSCPGTGSLAGDRCGSCTQSGGTTDGACRSTSLTPVCPSCPGGTTSYGTFGCTTGNWRCRCVIPITYSYSIRQTATSTTYSYYTIGESTSTTYSYSIRNTVSTTTYSYYTTRRVTVSYSSWYRRGTVLTTVYDYNKWEQKYETAFPIRETQTIYRITKYYKKVAAVETTQYTYNANLSIYSYTSGSLSLQNSTVISSFAAQAGSAYSNLLYPSITKVAAVTTGNTINAVGYIGEYFDTASATNSGTKGTSVGLVSLPAVEKIGNELDNFSA